MGCGLSKGDLTAVQDGTNMSAAEVKEAYKGFKQENKSDKIDLAKFTKLVASMNTNKGRACTTLPFRARMVVYHIIMPTSSYSKYPTLQHPFTYCCINNF